MISPNRTFLRRRGFTLGEILLVLLVIALLAAITTPMLRWPSAMGSDASGAPQLLAMLRYARTASRRSGRRHVVRLAPDGDRCIATVVASGAPGGREPLPAQIAAVTAFSGPRQGADAIVTFGSSGPDQAYLIELAGEAGSTVRVEITHPSGLVRLASTDLGELAAIADHWEAQCRHAFP